MNTDTATTMEGLNPRDIITRIQAIRNDVTGLAMESYGGRNRELSMIMHKLDEARMWAIEYGITVGAYKTVDIAKIHADANTIAEIRKAAEARV